MNQKYPEPNNKQSELRDRLSGLDRSIDLVIEGSPSPNSRHSVGDLIGIDPHDQSDHPSVGGIYVLYDISDRPLYVGQGSAIDKRVRSHNEKFWFKPPIVESASYVRIDDKTLRERVEEVLIKFLKSNAIINKRFVDR